MLALVAYTYDHGGGQPGNLYFELSRALRSRKPAERARALSHYLFFLLRGLEKLPAVKGVVYRGYPDRATTTAHYKVGRPIQWGAFASTSRDRTATYKFTDKSTGVIFKLTISSGREVSRYSYFQGEQEVLISPQARFTVASAAYVAPDGFTYIDMVETSGTVYIS